MFLCPGEKKALYAPPTIPMEPWGKDWTSHPQGLRNWGLIPNKMENCSCHKQSPTWNLGKDSKHMRNCTLNFHQFPVWNLGTESMAGVFHSKTWKLHSERLRAWLQAESSVSSIGCRQNHLPAQADLPCKGSQLYWELESKVNGAQTERNLPMALGNGEKDCELKSIHGAPCLCSLLSPNAIGSLLQSHCCHQIW